MSICQVARLVVEKARSAGIRGHCIIGGRSAVIFRDRLRIRLALLPADGRAHLSHRYTHYLSAFKDSWGPQVMLADLLGPEFARTLHPVPGERGPPPAQLAIMQQNGKGSEAIMAFSLSCIRRWVES